MDKADTRTDITFECKVHFKDGRRGRKKICEGDAPTPHPVEPGNIPRISRLMALAIRFEGLVNQGEVRDYADLARLGSVSRARITQIMNLLNLASDIQEDLLHLPRVFKGYAPIKYLDLAPIIQTPVWKRQRGQWVDLLRKKSVSLAR